MKKLKYFVSVWVILINAGKIASQVNYERPSALIEISTALGVNREIKLDKPKLNNELLDYSICTDGAFPLLLKTGLYATCPVWDIQQISSLNGRIFVELKNGGKLNGKPIGSITSEDDKSYSMNSITKISFIDISDKYKNYVTSSFDKLTAKSSDSWKLRVGATDTTSFIIRNPTFYIRYYTTEGYIMGGSTTVNDINSFWISRNGEKIEAILSDFKKVKIENLTENSRITLTSAADIITSGSLILKYEDSIGWHNAMSWGLVGAMQGTENTLLMATQTTIRLEKMN